MSRLRDESREAHVLLSLNCIMSPYGCVAQYHAFISSSCAVIKCCSFAKHSLFSRSVMLSQMKDTEKEEYSGMKLMPKCSLN